MTSSADSHQATSLAETEAKRFASNQDKGQVYQLDDFVNFLPLYPKLLTLDHAITRT